MDQTTTLLALIGAAGLGVIATLVILRRERRDADVPPEERPFAASTEGMQRCPACGVGNSVTQRDCSACGRRLPG